MAAGQEAHASDKGSMDISEHRGTFNAFLKISEWGTVGVVMTVALLTFAFAMGLGWWAGLAVWTLIGVGAGFVLRMGAAWWAAMIGVTLVLALGGGIVAGLSAIF